MQLRGSVGRDTKSRRQCSNWPDDQQTVMDLLNGIPVVRGGAGGRLHGRITPGIASLELCRAISQFEDQHFPGQHSGSVDPGGAMWNRMLQVLNEQPRVHHQDITIMKVVDKSSPKLF